MEPWNIKQIARELAESYDMCQSEFERAMWRSTVKKDCQRIVGDRKPTPGEQAILDQYKIVI